MADFTKMIFKSLGIVIMKEKLDFEAFLSPK